jgi:hypothetical protein
MFGGSLLLSSLNRILTDFSSSPWSNTMESAARIELYVPDRAVARHESAFQGWVETVTAPLRYVCVGEGHKTRFCATPLGKYVENFEEKAEDAPRSGEDASKQRGKDRTRRQVRTPPSACDWRELPWHGDCEKRPIMSSHLSAGERCSTAFRTGLLLR